MDWYSYSSVPTCLIHPVTRKFMRLFLWLTRLTLTRTLQRMHWSKGLLIGRWPGLPPNPQLPWKPVNLWLVQMHNLFSFFNFATRLTNKNYEPWEMWNFCINPNVSAWVKINSYIYFFIYIYNTVLELYEKPIKTNRSSISDIHHQLQ